jgi:hypothetical protein
MSSFGVGPACRGFLAASRVHNMDTLGIEPRASRMLSGCDTTTPCAPMLMRGWRLLHAQCRLCGVVRACVCVCVVVSVSVSVSVSVCVCFALASVCNVTAVGFEPTPLRTGALSQRLRPLGQTVFSVVCVWVCRRFSSWLGFSNALCIAPPLNVDSCGVRTHALADWRLEPAP